MSCFIRKKPCKKTVLELLTLRCLASYLNLDDVNYFPEENFRLNEERNPPKKGKLSYNI